MLNRYLFLISLFIAVSVAYAQRIDTVEVYSPKMDRMIKNVVILPEQYNKNPKARYPVLFLLHGVGGNYRTWITVSKPSLPQEANRWNMIIVCPDGQKSWYWDSPADRHYQFETFIGKELVEYIDKNYRTVASPQGRAISGYSMGGHGGLWIGINHPDIFGACGAMSGGVDIRPFATKWEMARFLGKTYQDDVQLWDNHTVMGILNKIVPGRQAIIFDCGREDMFYQINERLHNELLYRNIPHNYISRPGKHEQAYWNNAVDYQLMFFSSFFTSPNKLK